jgi:hypothetical protein
VCTWRLESARILRYVFIAYAVAVVATWLIPSGLGENIARLRYLAVPLALLVLALRRWRPLPLALGVMTLALAWNITPLASGWARGEADATSHAAVWRAPIAYLHAHLRPGYRVEAVDTAEHWPAFYLAGDGIPLARGWFRQDDFPLDSVLYRKLSPAAYLRWLRELGVQYVVLANAPPDYSSQREARLVRSGRARLRRVFATPVVSVYAVPRPQQMVTGPGRPAVVRLTREALVVHVSRAGEFRIATRWSRYWNASSGCLARTGNGLLLLRTRRPGTVRIAFDVDARSLLGAFAGTARTCR